MLIIQSIPTKYCSAKKYEGKHFKMASFLNHFASFFPGNQTKTKCRIAINTETIMPLP